MFYIDSNLSDWIWIEFLLFKHNIAYNKYINDRQSDYIANLIEWVWSNGSRDAIQHMTLCRLY